MALLSRNADRIYWAARYMERAEDTARVVRCFGDMLADYPITSEARWASLVAVAGGELDLPADSGLHEAAVVRFLVADPEHSSSISRSVESCRENLRTCREVLPREAWQTVNDLHLYTRAAASNSLDRRRREPFLNRVINDSRRLDGVATSSMLRDEAFELWRMGRYLERADMTTRVVGVRAATLLSLRPDETDEFAEVRWMSVLRSLSALQMYQRSTPGPIDGPDVVRFLLFDHRFPRSVAGCLAEMRQSVLRLPTNDEVMQGVEQVDRELNSCRPSADDGVALDDAMDRVQLAIAELHGAIADRYLQSS